MKKGVGRYEQGERAPARGMKGEGGLGSRKELTPDRHFTKRPRRGLQKGWGMEGGDASRNGGGGVDGQKGVVLAVPEKEKNRYKVVVRNPLGRREVREDKVTKQKTRRKIEEKGPTPEKTVGAPGTVWSKKPERSCFLSGEGKLQTLFLQTRKR